MYPNVPNDYYHIHHIFETVGRDIFNYYWTELELEVGQKNYLHNSFSFMEEYFLKSVLKLSTGLNGPLLYKKLIEMGRTREEMLLHLKNEFIEKAKKDFEIPVREKRHPFLHFIRPGILAEDLGQHIQVLVQCFVTKSRVLLLLSIPFIETSIQEHKTGHLKRIPSDYWKDAESNERPDFEVDFFEGTGTYKFYDESRFEIYKGSILIHKKSFDLFREGKNPNAAFMNLFMDQPEEPFLNSPLPIPMKLLFPEEDSQSQGSTYMQLFSKCYRDLQISLENQPSKRAVEAWISENAPLLKSQREKDYFFTFLREPEMKKGGVFTGRVRKRSKISSS